MTTYAVIKNDLVVNKIIAESKEIAEAVTGLSCVETENPELVEIDSSYLNGQFVGKSPYPSWTYDSQLEEWVAPVLKPVNENFYIWSEEDLNWEIYTE